MKRSLLARIRCATGNHPSFGQTQVLVKADWSKGAKKVLKEGRYVTKECGLCKRIYRVRVGEGR